MINRRKHRPKIGLALGGGGARGLAHIGVLKILEREMIPVDLILGTSIGALVGAAYAVNPDARALEKRVLELPFNKKLFLWLGGIGARLGKVLNRHTNQGCPRIRVLMKLSD